MDRLQIRMDYALNLLRTAEYEEAKIVFHQLLKMYTAQNQTENMCLCLYRLATIAYMRGEMQQFNTLFTHYETLAHETSHPQLQANYYVLRGLTLLTALHYEQAIHAFTNVLPVAEQFNLVDEKIIALLHIQQCHISLQRFALSLEMSNIYWEKYAHAITLMPTSYVDYILNRVETLLALQQLKEAHTLLKKCESHADLVSMPRKHIQALMLRANYYMKKRELNCTMKTLQQALSIAKDIEDVNVLNPLYEALLKNCEMRGKTKQSLQFAKQQLILQKKINPLSSKTRGET